MTVGSSVQSVSHVQLFLTPWTAARQVSLSITNSRSLVKLMSIELVMPSNHFILCCPLLLLPSIFSSIRVFQMSQLFVSGGQSTGASALTSVLPMNLQGWFPDQTMVDWFDLLAVQRTLKKSSLTPQFEASILQHSAFFNGPTLIPTHDYWKNHSFD